ncbi:hypothetical protein [Dietzia sp. PP-33]|jgi:hypothetical protein|uniref:hypothetical protein n=1 Tax=Dietzia sp. PP-33 TaxID=2957500 RepID=UPI0029AA5764|nr:hypothetical protein [Dietzia sp. PP-33]MDX2356403.1 hypothetical protein [Dietzia sp. PP-33]
MSAPPPAAPTDPDSTGPTPSDPSETTDPAVFAPVRSAVAAVGTLLLIGIPTDILPNPLFGREIPVRWWEYPVLAATVLLTAAWFGIRSAREAGTASRVGSDRPERPALVTVGVFTAWFAVACPVCNKIVLLLLGTTGALGVWAPLQPWLAALSLALLTGAVVYRWRARPCGDGACAVGGRPAIVGAPTR